MSRLDAALLAEKVAAVERHLARVASKLPEEPAALLPATDVSDAVILHLWQATQICIDLAVSACLLAQLGAPSGYGDAFERLAVGGWLERPLADRLKRAAGFRNVVAHAYGTLDMARVHGAALHGPADLRGFLRAVRDRLAGPAT